jgi:hypothetical protein
VKPTAGRDLPVLYLDYDGVLHHEDVWRHPRHGLYFGPSGQGHAFFEHADLLESVLAPYPQVRIVLSTSWVRVLTYERAKRQLPKRLQARVVGATYHSGMPREVFESLARGEQVLSDVRRRLPARWVAVDDDSEGPDEYQRHLVRSDSALGLRGPGVLDELQRHIRRLAGDAV